MGVSSGIDLIAGVLRNAPGQDVQGNVDAFASPARVANTARSEGTTSFADTVRSAIEGQAKPVDYSSADLVRVERAKKEDGEQLLQRLLLNTVVETILPKDVTSFTGSGTAGNVWRSMLAENIAEELSKSMDLKLLDGHRYGMKTAEGAQGQTNQVTPALVAERKRNA